MIVHLHIGNLWVKKTNNKQINLVGWIWIGNGAGKPKKTMAIRIYPNSLKTDPKQPDYKISDWTKEYKNGKDT